MVLFIEREQKWQKICTTVFILYLNIVPIVTSHIVFLYKKKSNVTYSASGSFQDSNLYILDA